LSIVVIDAIEEYLKARARWSARPPHDDPHVGSEKNNNLWVLKHTQKRKLVEPDSSSNNFT
jgi:hypothetical protein